MRVYVCSCAGLWAYARVFGCVCAGAPLQRTISLPPPYRNLRERRLVTHATEARALTALASWARASLEGFPTLLESDLQRLADMRSGPSGSPASTDKATALMAPAPTSKERAGHGRGDGPSAGSDDPCAHVAGDAVAGCRKREFEAAVGDVPARTEVALRYRVERKLLLGAALLLLGTLRAQATARDVT